MGVKPAGGGGEEFWLPGNPPSLQKVGRVTLEQ